LSCGISTSRKPSSIEVAQLVEVVLELVILETTGAGQPREHPPLFGLHCPAELAGSDVLVSRETDLGDLYLFALADLENDRAETAHAILVHGVVDRDLIVPGLLVVIPQLLGVLLDLTLVEGLVGFDLDLLLEARGFDLGVTLELDRKHAELGRDLDDEIEGHRVDRLVLHFNKLEKPGTVQRTDVAIENDLVELPALPNLHVRAHHLLVNVGGADELDGHRADLVGRCHGTDGLGGLGRLGSALGLTYGNPCQTGTSN